MNYDLSAFNHTLISKLISVMEYDILTRKKPQILGVYQISSQTWKSYKECYAVCWGGSITTMTNEDAREDEISDRLLKVPVGRHYLVRYSDLPSMRKVYSKYVKDQILENPNHIIILMLYYDTTDKVRKVLETRGIQVREKEREGSLVIVDIEDAIKNPYFEGPYEEKLRAFTKNLEAKYPDKIIFVIADMSIFNHLKRSSELLEYERTLHKDLKVEKWKELCFYNERDFDIMFGKEQIQELLEYHKDRVITI